MRAFVLAFHRWLRSSGRVAVPLLATAVSLTILQTFVALRHSETNAGYGEWVKFIYQLVGSSVTSSMSKIDDQFYDLRVRAFGRKKADPRIWLAGLDDGYFARNLHTRPTHARVLETLQKAGAQVVFYDVLFDEDRDPASDERLCEAVEQTGLAVLAENVVRNAGGAIAAPRLIEGLNRAIARGRASAGLINVSDDPRRWATVAMQIKSDELGELPPYPSAALAILAWLTRQGPGDLQYTPNWITANPRRVPVHRSVKQEREATLTLYRVPMTYHRRCTGPGAKAGPDTFKLISYAQLVDQDPEVLKGLKDAIVVVGDNRTGDSDLVETPGGQMKGFEVHAQILNSLLDGNVWRRPEPGTPLAYVNLALVGLLTFLVGWVVMSQPTVLRSLLGAFLGIGLGLLLLLGAAASGYLWNVAFYLYACVMCMPLWLLGRFFLTAQFLEAFIPKEVVQQLLRTGKAQEGEVEATVIVTDIRGYTTLSETKTPLQILTMLNEYHTETVAIYHRYRGNVLNYQGDAQIVLFGLPGQNLKDPAGNAVKAALETSKAVEDLRRRWGIAEKANFDVGAGVCTGTVAVGELGGAAENTEYTVIGETVRKCHKVQSMSSALDSNVLMDELTFQKITSRTKGQLSLERVENVEVEGINYPVTLYRTFEQG